MPPRSGDSRRERSLATTRAPSAPARPRAAAAADRAACCLAAGYAPRRTETLDPGRSCGSVVLVDQATQHVPAADLCERRAARVVRLPCGSGKRQRAMRALRVVVGHIAAKDLLELAAPEHQDVIQPVVAT